MGFFTKNDKKTVMEVTRKTVEKASVKTMNRYKINSFNGTNAGSKFLIQLESETEVKTSKNRIRKWPRNFAR
jgi:hypothetical protein